MSLEYIYEMTNGKGERVTAKVEIFTDVRLRLLAARLAQRARRSKSKVATGAHGVIRVRVTILNEETQP